MTFSENREGTCQFILQDQYHNRAKSDKYSIRKEHYRLILLKNIDTVVLQKHLSNLNPTVYNNDSTQYLVTK